MVGNGVQVVVYFLPLGNCLRVAAPFPVADTKWLCCAGQHLGAECQLGVTLGHSAMSAPVSALPESGHCWTIYEYTSWLSRFRFGTIRTGMDHQTAYYSVVGGLRMGVP